MAESVGGVGIHQDASDVYFDRPCESCSEDGKHIEAISFCSICDTFLCQKCLKVHSRLASTKSHPVLYGDDMPKSLDEKPVKYPPCKAHDRDIMDKYCLNHEIMVCEKCSEENHTSCIVKSISEVCQTFDQVKIQRLADTVADARRRAVTATTYLQVEFNRIEKLKECMLSDLKELYTDAIDFILRLYKETQDKIEDTLSDRKRDIAKYINDIDNFIGHFDILSDDLNKVRKSSFNERYLVQFQQLLHNVNKTKDDFLDADVLECKEISFKISEELQEFLAKCSALGYIRTETTWIRSSGDEIQVYSNRPGEDLNYTESEAIIKKKEHKSFSAECDTDFASSEVERGSSTFKPQSKVDVDEIKVIQRQQINASTNEDKLACFITGIAVRENGDILVVDWNNNKVKLFAPDVKMLSFLKLSSLKLVYWPCETCFVGEKTAIVCLSGTNRLHILKISETNSITLEKTISLTGTNIWSVTPYDLELVITCGIKPNVIKVLKMDGEVDWTIETDKKGQRLFENINSVSTLGKYSRKVVVADKVKASVSLVHVDRGEILYTCAVNDKIPNSVTVDQRNDHVYVYYKDTKEILVWSEDLSRSICLCNDLKREPAAITFDNQAGQLLVSYESCDTLDRMVMQTIT